MPRREITNTAPRDYDVAIIGGGPAGVAAAIGIASEGPSVVVLDERGPGGQIARSSKIENVFGVPAGGGDGGRLMARGIDQAKNLKAQFRSPFRAFKIIKNEGRTFTVKAMNHEFLRAVAVVLALGVSYRRLNADGIEQFGGRGVSYGSPQYQYPRQWEGKRVGIIGGGNSAGQAALFLSGCEGCQANIFIRDVDLESNMSSYLVDHIAELTNITVHPLSTLQ
jgi:thioredoxin reductase (NADPH)